jgi:hypothetical protein
MEIYVQGDLPSAEYIQRVMKYYSILRNKLKRGSSMEVGV